MGYISQSQLVICCVVLVIFSGQAVVNILVQLLT